MKVPQHFAIVYNYTLMDIVLYMAMLNKYRQDFCHTKFS